MVRLPSRTVLGLALSLTVAVPASLALLPEERRATPSASPVETMRDAIAFEANVGQTDRRVRFMSRGAGYSLFLTDDESVLALDRGQDRAAAVLRTRLVGADPRRARGEAVLPGRVNIYRGRRSHEGIRTFGRVRYGAPYPGIDLVYHGKQGALEYDFEVAPGADPGRIALALEGARKLGLSPRGDLRVAVPGGVVVHRRPVAYQVIDGRRVNVGAAFELAGNRVGFRLGEYDASRKLVIDPVLSYSSYLGGSALDAPIKIARGSDNAVYITGRTLSNDFPGTSRDNARSDFDAFVTKLNPDGSRVYSTYVGSSGTDQGYDVAVDGSHRAYVVGDTTGTAATFAPFALDSCDDGQADAFLVRLNANGTVNYKTCLGGDQYDVATGVAVRESSGTPEAYVTGSLGAQFGTYPGTGQQSAVNGYQTSCCTGSAGFLAKVRFGSSVTLPYLTYLDGSGSDRGRAVAVDSAGNAYVASQSTSTSLGGTTRSGTADEGVVVTKIDTTKTGTDGPSSRLYSTWIEGSGGEFLGNPNGDGWAYGTVSTTGGIEVNSSGVAYVAGSTSSTDLPQKVTSNTFKHVGGNAGFIGVVGANGAVARSIYVDGTGETHLSDVALQESGGVTSVYAVGGTDGTIAGLNTLSGQSCADVSANHPDALLVKIADGATPMGIYFTCLGGTGDDDGTSIASGPGTDPTAWVTGATTGSFPTVSPHQTDASTAPDGFVARIGHNPPSIDSGPDAGAVIGSRHATFTFSTSQPGMTFRCSVPEGGRLIAGNALGACSGSGTAAYSDLSNGQHTFEVATVDAGGAQAVASRSFSVDTAGPNAAYVVAPNPVLVNRPASFDAGSSSPTSAAIVRYEWDLDGNGSFETDGGGSPTTTKTYSTAGDIQTALRVTDASGASGTASVSLRVTDPSALGTQVGVSINKGAQYTNTPDVTLTILAPSGSTGLLLSNDGGFAGALPLPVTPTARWRLDSSGPERLPKTVYLRFLTGTFASSNYTDDIILDERPPVVNSAAVEGAPAASGARAAALRRYRLRIRATDTNSGVGHVQVTSNKRRPGKLIRYKRRLAVRVPARPKFLRARDRAGNFSRWKKLR